MAIARGQGQGGITAIHIWLIIFVALWLTATVFLVILYMERADEQAKMTDLKTQLTRVISAQGKSLPAYQQAKPNAGATMVDLLESARRQTTELLSGNPDDDPAVLRERLNDLLTRIKASRYIEDPSIINDGSCLAALDATYNQLQSKGRDLDEAQQGMQQLQADLKALRDEQAQQKTDFAQQADQLKAQLASIETDRSDYRQQRDTEIDDFQKKLDDLKQQCFEDIQTQRTDNASLRKDYDDLLARYQGLKDKLGQEQIRPVPLATARRGDGVIMTAKPGEDVVYIDLGAKNGMTLGLEFAVYDALGGIPENGRAKGRIEVVNINELSSECRIVDMLSTDPIVAGDIIANPIYDRNRKLSFFVLGEFDLNGDGRYDPDGADRIKALIRHWGGQVVDTLTAQVDFVVLGGAPKKPQKPLNLSPEEERRYEAAERAYDRYESNKTAVANLAVPTLTQTVFLNFLGYDGAQPESELALFGH